MKKILILMLVLVLLLTGCAGNGQTDEPADAQKDNPVAEQDGKEPEQDACEALGHDMAEATCENPSACTRCGKTEGEKLSRPAYTLQQIEESEAYGQLLQMVDTLVGQDRSMTYDEGTNLLHFSLVPNSGAAEAYSQRGDNWGLFTEYLKTAASYGCHLFSREEIQIDVRVTLLDDRDRTKTLFDVKNTEILTDVYADLVPDVLRTAAFQTMFSTVNVNYLFIPKTAIYDETSQTVVFYLMMEDNTAFHIRNLLSQGKLGEYGMWKNLTAAMVRWTDEGHSDFARDGYEIRCAAILLDGDLNGDPLFAARDGEVLFSIE